MNETNLNAVIQTIRIDGRSEDPISLEWVVITAEDL
ncbi:hypothetical protein K227x_63600 [Rubripirellula lacrimiformis]|uniref:Uncharacterized protein n=1 Tax=Rubripirellula lacrimiformis TaxID=1930273 RepID=A0A517NLC8_9BACT|nr:hypothetical protein K227x_63600 [Rubripirellula lacrimiformis]